MKSKIQNLKLCRLGLQDIFQCIFFWLFSHLTSESNTTKLALSLFFLQLQLNPVECTPGWALHKPSIKLLYSLKKTVTCSKTMKKNRNVKCNFTDNFFLRNWANGFTFLIRFQNAHKYFGTSSSGRVCLIYAKLLMHVLQGLPCSPSAAAAVTFSHW